MSRHALLAKLKAQAELMATDDTVRQISDLMDELSAKVVNGAPVPPMSLAELMEDSYVPQSPKG